jgi:hypothetical protein
MAATTFDLEIYFEDESKTLVRADQRDMAAFEVEYKIGTSQAIEKMTMVFFRFLGWHAARRLGLVMLGEPREVWLGKVVSVEPLDDEVEADPGKPAA